MSKIKAMISQPMASKTDEEIQEARNKFLAWAERNNYEVVNTLFTDEWYSPESMEKRGVVHKPLCFLAKSLENMSLCDVVYFAKGWNMARGCLIEREAALQYGITIVEDYTDN